MKSNYGPQHSSEMGAFLRTALENLQDKYPVIGDVRGRGLMQGVELITDRVSKEPSSVAANAMLNTTREIGMLIGKGGLYGNVLNIAPPLTANEEHIEEVLEKLDYVFAQVQELV